MSHDMTARCAHCPHCVRAQKVASVLIGELKRMDTPESRHALAMARDLDHDPVHVICDCEDGCHDTKN